MRLSDAILALRMRVKDTQKLHWSEAECVAALNTWQRSLFRRKANAHPSYGARNIDLYVADSPDRANQVDDLEWTYDLPAWVHRVDRIWPLENGEQRPKIPYYTEQYRTGWKFSGQRQVTIHGYSVAKDLRLRVQKIPSLMVRGTLVADSPDLGYIYIPAQLAVETGETIPFPLDIEDGALLGATIEMMTATATRDPRGVLSVVQSVERVYNPTIAAWQYECLVRPQFPAFVKAGDLFEFHSEIEDLHAELMILRAAETLFQSTNNIAGVQVLQPQLRSEEFDFNNSLQPRQTAAVHMVECEEDDPLIFRDPDRDNTLA